MIEEDLIHKLIDTQVVKENVAIYYREIGDQGLAYLLTKDTKHIRQIWLAFNNITDIGISLFQRMNWDNITHLNLQANRIKNKGCLYISRTPLIKLQWLKLSRNQIECEGVQHLSKKKFPLLQFIDISECKIAVGCISYLIRSNWQQIKTIRIYFNTIRPFQTINFSCSPFKRLKQIRYDFYRVQQKNNFFRTAQNDKIQQILKKQFSLFGKKINSPFQ